LRRLLERINVFERVRYFHEASPRHIDPKLTKGTKYYDEDRIVTFGNMVICAAGFVMVVLPLWILFILDGRRSAQLGVISTCILLFSGGVQGVSENPKPFESLAATAA
jgi:hypothetical protein